MKQTIITLMTLVAFSFVMERTTHAEDSVGEKAQEMVQDAGKNVKKGVRHAKDETCEYIKGKMECTKDKIKHKVKNASDEVHDKMN